MLNISNTNENNDPVQSETSVDIPQLAEEASPNINVTANQGDRTNTNDLTNEEHISLQKPASEEAMSSGREKRVRKIKKFDDNYFLFDSKPKAVKKEPEVPMYVQQNDSEEAANEEDLEETSSLQSEVVVEPIYVSQNTPTDSTNARYAAGDLVWARVGSYPWWPCMISNLPQPSNLKEIEADSHNTRYVKYSGVLRPKRTFSVLFFGSAKEHAWVFESCIIDYKGENIHYTFIPPLHFWDLI